MSEGCKTWFATRNSSSKVVLFVVPLILLSGFASLLFERASIYTLPTSSSSSNTTDLDKTVTNYSLHAKDLHSSLSDQNNSVSPPINAQSFQVQQSNGGNEDISNTSIRQRFDFNESMEQSKSIGPPSKQERKRDYTNLDRLEDGLRRARAAIKEAINGTQLQDPDSINLSGPIYKNPKFFHRSYLEMEKRFKIYVYKEGELPLFHDGPCMLSYAIEGLFINKMEINKNFRTHNPEKAHVFYLPYSVARIVRHIWVKGVPIRTLGGMVSDYVKIISGKHPYWNRSHGADHFMLSCHDWGPATSFYAPELVSNSIRALCNANTSERFNPKKDVSIPEIRFQSSHLEDLIGGSSPSQRTILAFFAGGNHGAVRPILFKHWYNRDTDIRIHEYLPKGVSYYDTMRQTKYCLCPSGYEVASPRIVEALYNGCVPVLISVNYVLPFSDVLDWEVFTVTVSLEDVPNLKEILMGIPESKYLRMQKRVIQVRRHFELHETPKRFDVFHMILHSIWLRRLNIKVNNEGGDVTN